MTVHVQFALDPEKAYRILKEMIKEERRQARSKKNGVRIAPVALYPSSRGEAVNPVVKERQAETSG